MNIITIESVGFSAKVHHDKNRQRKSTIARVRIYHKQLIIESISVFIEKKTTILIVSTVQIVQPARPFEEVHSLTIFECVRLQTNEFTRKPTEPHLAIGIYRDSWTAKYKGFRKII